MKKIFFLGLLVTLYVGMFSFCKDENQTDFKPFDPSQPLEVTGFYPDSGGIATPFVIEGKNFGSDTAGMKVYFVDTLGVKHQAGLVSSNGNKIYAFVPKLTYLRKMDIMVERTSKDGKVVSGISNYNFFYKTQTSVTTVLGKPEPNNNSVPTIGGDFTTASLSAPFAICLDDEDNIFIVERSWNAQGHSSIQRARNDKGEDVGSNIVLADTKGQAVVVMKYGANHSNAPAFSDELGNEAVYVPEDAGLYYYQMLKSLTYAPRNRSLILDEETKNVIEGNWKYSFVVNKNDHMVYTVMWKGQLVRFNPVTRNVEVLLDKVTPDVPNAHAGANGSNTYCVFSPLETNMLYFCMEDYNLISRVDISALGDKDKATYKGEPYAGKTISDGPVNGRGWEDGLLENARFFAPKQMAFTSDGKLYIADNNNHCIRVIDTTVPKNQATVNTSIGLPQSPGFQDGGPEFAKFYYPTGVAVNSDGSVLYVADSRNHVIRKLSIE
ncbi:MAG: hypothetical protein PHI70_03450 [Proteiniphilum sp.]|nr:hypothetical protein [Proteiniphilum sp.]MDD4415823.1 hypothetical protein [Proteiniphilum sp.]